MQLSKLFYSILFKPDPRVAFVSQFACSFSIATDSPRQVLVDVILLTVYDADEYAIELICPFQYDIDGLKNFILRAQEKQIGWIKSKSGDDLDFRLENIEFLAEPCGEGGVTNLEQYKRKIKNFLPN